MRQRSLVGGAPRSAWEDDRLVPGGLDAFERPSATVPRREAEECPPVRDLEAEVLAMFATTNQ
ncbi:hypothetical protein [Roseomonas rosulenta]|uniref:hypothetical protein n=1 Tax=Roseomonas rosulenta TaxID=2748667 RepID=UPI0018E012E2|nr:hypothetical protein [Roseomonas rosulenta]